MNLNIQNCKQFSQNVVPNTFIGGIAKQGGTGADEPIDTAWKLSQKLNINVNRISGFRVIGDDVECRIKGNFNIPTYSFSENSNIISFEHHEDLLKNVGTLAFLNSSLNIFHSASETTQTMQRGFDSATNLSNFYWDLFKGVLQNYTYRGINVSGQIRFKYVTSIINNNFDSAKCSEFIFDNLESIGSSSSEFLGNNFLNTTNATLIQMKKLKSIGLNPNINKNNFQNIKTNCLIQVHINLSTIDEGNAAADLLYAKNIRNAIVEFYDDDGNYVSTL